MVSSAFFAVCFVFGVACSHRLSPLFSAGLGLGCVSFAVQLWVVEFACLILEICLLAVESAMLNCGCVMFACSVLAVVAAL